MPSNTYRATMATNNDGDSVEVDLSTVHEYTGVDDDMSESDDEWDDRGGHQIATKVDVDYDLHDNKVRDLVRYDRANTIRNEQQFVVSTLGYLTGYFTDIDHFVAGVIIGTSSSGKTHMQGTIEDLFDNEHLYQATSGTDKSLIYDGSWEDAFIASLDELNKPSDQLIEFLKSVHGDDTQFEYKITAGDAGDGADRDVDTIIRTAKPYWFLYAQYEPDFEMWNRLLKVPVHESESKNRAVFRMCGDIRNIQIGDEDHTYNFEFEGGKRALQQHIANIPTEAPGRVALPNGQNVRDWAVADIIEPIFNHGRSESNRAYDMVFNLIRASALLNYDQREIRDVTDESGETFEAIIANQQDVANILSCRDVLLATTHELDRKKKAICKAISTKGGTMNEATIADIMEYMRESDAPEVNRDELENILSDLEKNYLAYKHERAGPNNEHIYEFLGFSELGMANVPEYSELFMDTYDPIREENFLDSYEQRRDELRPSAADFMVDAEVSSGSEPQRTLAGDTTDDIAIDLAPHEELVCEQVRDTLDGKTVGGLTDIPVEQLVGLVSLGRDVSGSMVDYTDTVLDPDHDVWKQPDRPDDWITSERDAEREVEQTIRKLVDEGVILAEKTFEEGTVVEADITVKGSAD